MVVVSPDPIHLLFILKDTLFYALFVLAFHSACRGSYKVHECSCFIEFIKRVGEKI